MTRLCIVCQIPVFSGLLGKLDSSTWDGFKKIAKESASSAGDVGLCLENGHEHGHEHGHESWKI